MPQPPYLCPYSPCKTINNTYPSFGRARSWLGLGTQCNWTLFASLFHFGRLPSAFTRRTIQMANAKWIIGFALTITAVKRLHGVPRIWFSNWTGVPPSNMKEITANDRHLVIAFLPSSLQFPLMIAFVVRRDATGWIRMISLRLWNATTHLGKVQQTKANLQTRSEKLRH